MTGPLTEFAQRQYEEEGIVFPISVLSANEVSKYRTACDELEEQLGGKPRTVEVRQMHMHFPWAYELSTHPRVLDAVEAVLGPDLLIWATELFAKHPRDSTVSIGWHRDRPYMGFEGGVTATAWIALSNSNSFNGCMRAVPGPKRGDMVVADLTEDPCRGSPQGTTRAPADRPPIVDVILRPGEMSLHDADIPHGSRPNQSDEKRVGFVVRFITPEVQARDVRPLVVLARGHVGAQFELFPPPSSTSGHDALAALKQSAARHLDAVLRNRRRANP
jgi:ectoine hydroxylase-related dioxygenase (phytanoyl-CoA dioxygenase family)